MEVQVKARASTGGVITLVYLFEVWEKEHNMFLLQLGFLDSKLKNLKTFNETKAHTLIGTDISLHELIGNNTGHMLYEGSSLWDSCEPTLYLVSKDISWMSEQQLLEVSGSPKIRQTGQRAILMNVYQNIDQNMDNNPYPLWLALRPPKVPSSFLHSQFMYNPVDGDEFGLIEPQMYPGWETINKTIWQVPMLNQLPYGLKYIPFMYEPLPSGELVPVFIIVPKEFSWTQDWQPAGVKMLVRSNIPDVLTGVKKLVWITTGIKRIDPSVLDTIQNLEDQMKRQEREAALKEAQRRRDADNIEKKKQEEEAAKKKAAEDEAKRLADIQAKKAELEKKRQSIRWERRCVKWRLESIVNRKFENEDAWDIKGIWEGGNSDLYKCVEWKDVRIGDWGEDIPDGSPIVPPNPNPNPSPTPSKPNNTVEINKKKCPTYLNVILNRRFKDTNFRDLVEKECKNYTSLNFTRSLPSLAVSGQEDISQNYPSVNYETDGHYGQQLLDPNLQGHLNH